MNNFPMKTEPYAHQLAGLNKTANFKFAALFMEQGTGKTKIAIDRSSHLYKEGKIDAVIVICPKSLTVTWEEEIETHCGIPYASAIWDPNLRKKAVAKMEKVLYPAEGLLPFFIVNIEALRTPKGSKVADWFARHFRLHAVVDESSKIKTPSAKQTIAAINFARKTTARTILTGTPVSTSPADYYSQLEFLMPSPLGFNNFYSFRARYCVMEKKRIKLRKPRKNKKGEWIKFQEITQITGNKNADELKRKLLPFSFFVKKDECLDLPDKIYHLRYTNLSKQGMALYKSVKEQIITEIREDEFLTVEVQLAKFIRLQQIIGGFLPSDDDPETKPIPGTNPKIDLLMETIEQFPGATIIWARFKAEHKAIRRALESIVKPDQIGEIVGQIDKGVREENRQAFQSGRILYLICTQSCAGYGYTLTAAENEIYFSNTFSLEHRQQSEDRAHRIGQDKHVNIIDLVVPGTIDEKVIAALKSKQEMADLFTDVRDLEALI